jgi:putative ABC transport system ATP-binding protein
MVAQRNDCRTYRDRLLDWRLGQASGCLGRRKTTGGGIGSEKACWPRMDRSDPPPQSRDCAYRTEGLTKVYGEGAAAVHALRGVDLEVPAGEIVVLLGPSGSGKSTLLNIIGGLDRGTDGTVWFRDQDLSAMNDADLTRYRRDNVGFVFQFYNLMPSLTARENVELVTEIAEDPMEPGEALELVGLRERTDHFPAQLSGGEQQRVAIARAVAKRPKVLFCDEPTGALDSATGRTVLKVLKDVNETLGSTVLIVTHAAATAAMAHRVIHFADGDIRQIEENETRLDPEEIEW